MTKDYPHQHHPHPHLVHSQHPRSSYHVRWSVSLVAGIGIIVGLFEGIKIMWLYRRLEVYEQQQQSAATQFDDDLAVAFFWDAKKSQKRRPIIPNQLKELLATASKYSVQLETGKNAITPPDLKQHVCDAELTKMYQRHYCMLQASRRDFDECLLLLDDNSAKETDFNQTVLVPGPIHQLSYMDGQGFGRIVQQAVKTCILGSILQRPCSIDLYRDKYYNLRAFLQPGPYNWDTASHVVMSQNTESISDALHKMPQGLLKGHGWESLALSLADAPNEKPGVPTYDNVLPMVWGVKGTSEQLIQQHLDEWNANHPQNGHKVLLSPNFGDAWYGYGKDQIHLGLQFNSRFKPCNMNHMKTYLQNEMFAPTSLAYELHKERRALVLQEPELEEESKDSSNVLTTSSGMTARSVLPPYGAIHLRMNILNRDMYKFDISKEQVFDGLTKCFQTLLSDKDSSYSKMRWWLVSDDVEVAKYITDQLDNVYSYASSDEVERVGAGNAGMAEKKKAFKGIHSGDAMGQKFGQEATSPSIIDWMGLHESTIALITYSSAYGETGARGNGKVESGICGGQVKSGKRSFSMFSIYKQES